MNIDFMTVEYSLHALRYWLPRRFVLTGRARLAGFITLPVTLEWSVTDHDLNPGASPLHVDDLLPDGWRRHDVPADVDGPQSPVTVIVRSSEELRAFGDFSEAFGEPSPTVFTSEELAALSDAVADLAPDLERYHPRIAWGLRPGLLRYNRVEGLSSATVVTVPLGPKLTMKGTARIGTGNHKPNLSAEFARGPESGQWTLATYHQLGVMSPRGDPLGSLSSAANVLLGDDRSEYYRTTGVRIGYGLARRSVRVSLFAFQERQREVEVGATFSVRRLVGSDTVELLVAAERVDVRGLHGSVSWFNGTEPSRSIISGQATVELGAADVSYQRAAVGLALRHPLLAGLVGAVEVEAGGIWGDAPIQRQFFLGGAPALRGFRLNEAVGPRFWRARSEVAVGRPPLRPVLFADIVQFFDTGDPDLGDPLASASIGLSALDGLLRLDLARALKGGTRWKLHLYLDGLF